MRANEINPTNVVTASSHDHELHVAVKIVKRFAAAFLTELIMTFMIFNFSSISPILA
jgi:hypothetical protein